jgi:monofunctional glycosyltransferase
MRPRLPRWLKRLLLVLLLAPPALILAFRFLPVPATPLMLLRAAQGYGWQKDWVP